jgi:hypothetical protein
MNGGASTTQLTTTGSTYLATAGGNVGIGTTAPGALLDVNGISVFRGGISQTTGYFSMTATNGVGYLGRGTDILTGAVTNSISLRADGALHFGSGGNNIRATIDSTGNVGIGSTTPAAKLSLNTAATGLGMYIAGYANGTGNLFAISTSTASATSTALTVDQNGNLSLLNGAGLSVSGTTSYTGLTTFSNGFLSLASSTITSGLFSMNGGASTTQLTTTGSTYLATAGGNVGIGTTAPTSLLHAYGDAKDIAIDFPTSSSYGYFNFKQAGVSKADMTLIGSAFATTGRRGDLEIAANTGDLTLQASNGGNVGIGTTSPAFKLDVNGTIMASAYRGSQAGALTITSDQDITLALDADNNNISAFGVNNGGGSKILYVPESGAAYLNNTGNFGIGTTTPATKLQIWDTTAVTAFTGTQVQGVRINGGTAIGSNQYAMLGFGSGDTTAASYSNNLAQIGAKITNSGSYLQFGTSNSYGSGITNTALTIDPSGNVGIGTTTPSNLLDVGTGLAAGSHMISVNSTGNSGSTAGIQFYQPQFGTSYILQDSFGGYALSTGSAGNGMNFLSGRASPFDDYWFRNASGNVVGGFVNSSYSTANFGNFATTHNLVWGGSVGIGTTSPYSLLSISNSASTAANTPLFTIASTTAGTATSTLMTVLASGNVGVGTTNPLAKVHIVDTGFSGLSVDVVNSGTNVTNVSGIQVSNTNATTNNYAGIGFADNANGTNGYSASMGVQMTNRTSHYGDYVFATRAADGFLERMRIVSTGNVGIGTTSPSALLSIGNGLTNGGYYFTSTGLGIGRTSPSYPLDVVGGTRLAGYLIGVDSSAVIKYLFTNDGGASFINSGNVGIGTTTPGTLLSLGNTGANTINISNTATSTFGYGINLNTGCFAVNGTCVGAGTGSGTVSSGTTGQLPYYAADGTSLTATSSLFLATSGFFGVGTSTPRTLLSLQGSNPTISLWNTTPAANNQEWQIKNNQTGTLDFVDAKYSFTPLRIVPTASASIDTAEVRIGTTTNVSGNTSRLFVFGGSSGANVDIMGDPRIVGGDTGNVEIEGSDYATSQNSIAMTYSGPGALGTTMGFSNVKLGELKFSGASTAIIHTTNTTPLIFGVNDTERMRLTTTGTGIGTTSPYSLLSVQATAGGMTPLFTIASSTNGAATSTAFTILGNGNTGIGTNAPAATLHVTNTSGTLLKWTRTGAGSYTFGLSGGAVFGDTTDLVFGGEQNGGYLLQTNSGNTNALAINNAGSIGIGTTTPQALLHLNSDAGTAASGIKFGSDVSLYRVSANELKTDDNFTANKLTTIQPGTEAVPALTISTDSNTGMWEPTSDTLAFSTNAVERFRISPTGFIGIGSSTPWAQLSINPNDISGPVFAIGSSTATKFVVTNGGNVGIGTANPTVPLFIEQSGSGAPTAFLLNNSSVAAADLGSGLYFDGGSVHQAGYQSGWNGAATTDAYLAFYTRGSNSLTEKMRITSAGNVGIGSTSPYRKLSIVGGDVQIGDASASNNNNLIFVGKSGSVNAETNYIGFVNGYTDPVLSAKISFYRGGAGNDGQLAFSTATGGVNSEAMRLDTHGWLGIGTTSPFARVSLAGTAAGTTNLLAISTSTAASATSTALIIDRNGNLSLLNGANLTVGGDLSVTGATTYTGLTTFSNGFLSLASSTVTSGLFSMNGGASTTQLTTTGSTYLATAGGNVGIGTTASNLPLMVSAATGIVNTTSTTGTNRVFFQASNTGGNYSFGGENSVGNGLFAAGGGGLPYALAISAPASRVLQFGSGGTVRMTLDSNGLLGIGTTSPYSLLSISNSASTAVNTPLFTIASTTAGTATSTLMTVLASGNVGIGTNNPTQVLEVNGVAKVNSSLVVGSYGNFGSSNYFGQASSVLTGVGTNADAVVRSAAGNVYFAASTVTAPQMILTSSGNVGIGTTSPYSLLSISNSASTAVNTPLFTIASTTAGTATSTLMTVLANGHVIVGNGTDQSTFTIYTANTSAPFQFRNSSNSNNRIADVTLNSNAGIFELFDSADTAQIKLRADGNSSYFNVGNVGIGTTTPQGKLQVAADSTGLPQTGVYGQIEATLAATPTKRLSLGYDSGNDVGFIQALQNGVAYKNLLLNPSGGNVGIGTTSPASPLSIVASMGTLGVTPGEGIRVIRGSSPTQYISINEDDGSTHTIQAMGAKPLFFLNQDSTVSGTAFAFRGNNSVYRNTGTQFLTILNSGNIGVGSSTPWAQLSVNPDGITGPAFAIGSSTATKFVVDNAGNVGVGLTSPGIAKLYVAGASGVTTFSSAGTSIFANNGIGMIVSSRTGDIFEGYGSANGAVQKFTIQNDGDVGVASSTPWGMLSINPDGVTGPAFVIGSSTATNFIVTNGGKVGIGSSVPTGNLQIDSNYTTVGDVGYLEGVEINTINTSGVNISRLYGASTYANNDNASGVISHISGISATGGTTAGSVTYLSGAEFNSGVSGGSVTNQYGVWVNTYGSGTIQNRYGILIDESSGTATNDYGLYQSSATQKNYFAGATGIGSTTPWAQLSINPNGITGPAFAIGSSTATNFVVTNGGLTGIGTTSAFAQLDIFATTSAIGLNLAGAPFGTVNSTSAVGANAASIFTAVGATGQSVSFNNSVSRAGAGGGFSMTGGLGGDNSDTNVTGGLNHRAGVGGSFTVTGGLGGNATGGATAGQRGGSGGAITLTTGSGGTSNGAGVAGPAGTFTLQGGTGGVATGGANSGTGGSLVISGGPGGSNTVSGLSGNGGGVTIDAGSAGGASGAATAGTNGSILIGGAYASSITIGNTSVTGYYTNLVGNVGIGSTTPWAQLSINPNGITGPAFAIGSSTATKFIVTNGGKVGIGTTSPALPLSVMSSTGTTDSNSAFFAGRVGIGTSNPGSSLHIYSPTNSVSQQLQTDATGASGYAWGSYLTQTGALYIGQENSIGNNLLLGDLPNAGILGTETAQPVQFGTNNLVRMTLATDGTIGIGTSTPWGLLSINPDGITGPAFAIGSSTATKFIVTNGGNVGIGTTSPISKFTMVDTANGGNGWFESNANNVSIALNNTQTGGRRFDLQSSGGSGTPASAFRISDLTAGAVRLVVNATGDVGLGGSITTNAMSGSVMTVLASGSVGIGTTTPQKKFVVSDLTDQAAIGLFSGSSKGVRIGANGTTAGLIEGVDYTGGASYQPLQIGGSDLRFTISNSEKMRIDTTGFVGIASSSPVDTLGVAGNAVVSGDITINTKDGANHYFYNSDYGAYTKAAFNGPGDILGIQADALNVYSFSDKTSSGNALGGAVMSLKLNGNGTGGKVGIGTTSPSYLLGVGNSTVAGTIAQFENSTGSCYINPNNAFTGCTSDLRLKTNITPLSSELDKVLALNPVTFTWKTDGSNGTTHTGFIAQEVGEIFPDLVMQGADGYFALNYAGLTPYLTRAIQQLDQRTKSISSAATSTVLTIDAGGNVGIGTDTPNAKLAVSGNVFANAYETAAASPTSFLFGSTTTTAEVPSEVLTASGTVDLYKLATYTLSGVQALSERFAGFDTRIASLESRVAKLETGAVSSSGGSFTLSTSSLASALAGFGILVDKGIAQFDTLVFSKFVAGKDANGTSSAGSVTILAGNTVAQVANSFMKPSTKVFVTFSSSIEGSWWVSDKADGSFRVMLSGPQTKDVSFDYFLVQTEGQISDTGTASTTTSGPDTVAPTVTLLGDNPAHLTVGAAFTEPGVTVTDAVDGTDPYITFVNGIEQVASAATIDTTSPTTYIITYQATDKAGNMSTAMRSVIVGNPDGTVSTGSAATSTPASTDTTAPVVTLNGSAAIQLTLGDAFADPGATAADDVDGDLTSAIVETGAVDTATEGLYTLTYRATDKAGNMGSASRVVSVIASTTPTN